MHFSFTSFSQATIVSTTGYIVNISLEPLAIIPSGSSCQYGYSYSVRIKYKISFSGSNIPASMYTLQGTMGCGGSTQFFDLPNNGGNGTVLSANAWTSAHDCATATPADMSCTAMKVQIQGLGISSRTITVPMANIILGVNWEDFSASLIHNMVSLKWATASEDNNDFFTVERSANTVDWVDITRVNGDGNLGNRQDYGAMDASPLAGTSYYRIRQTDRDGRSTVSETRVIRNESLTTQGIGVFPVPNAGDNITLTGISNFAGHDLVVFNAGGNKVYATALSHASVKLPVLTPGLYFIQVKNKATGEISNIRYLKI